MQSFAKYTFTQCLNGRELLRYRDSNQNIIYYVNFNDYTSEAISISEHIFYTHMTEFKINLVGSFWSCILSMKISPLVFQLIYLNIEIL